MESCSVSWEKENLIRTELNQAQRRLEIEKRQMSEKKIYVRCELCYACIEDNEMSKIFIKHCRHIIGNFCLHASVFRYCHNEISLRDDCTAWYIHRFVSSTLSMKLPAKHYKILCSSLLTSLKESEKMKKKTLFHSHQFHFTMQAIVVVVISVTLVVSDKYSRFSPQLTLSLEPEAGDEMCELLENNKQQKTKLHRRWKDRFHFIFE